MTVDTRLEHLDFAGSFTPLFVTDGVRLVSGKIEALLLGVMIHLFLLVEEKDGVVCDARFQIFGPPKLIAACDLLCEFVLRKEWVVLQKVSEASLENQLDTDIPHIELIIDALQTALEQCEDIECSAELSFPTPVQEVQKGEYPGFMELSKEKKLQVIEESLDKDIRPFVEMDEGGLEVVDLKSNTLYIRYMGTCTSCPSSVGGTLSYIQHILSTKVHSSLVVEPLMGEVDV